MDLEHRTVALLELIDRYRLRRCAELTGPAIVEERAAVRSALAEARKRVRTAIAEERKRCSAEVGAAMAALATDRRLAHQRHDARVLAESWQGLRARLVERWTNASTRAHWVDAYLQRALTTLPRDPAGWRIEYGSGWNEAERGMTRDRLRRAGIDTVEFVLLDDIAAGLRIVCGHNVLDATVTGLMDDRVDLEGRLLHHLRAEEVA